MGHKFEVWNWVEDGDGGYSYDAAYAGEDFAEAMACMFDLKKNGARCVKFYWRGEDLQGE